EQLELKKQLIETDVVQWQLHSGAGGAAASDDTNCKLLRRVAGVDVSFLKGSNEHACASIVVLEYPSLTVLYEAFTYVSLPAPYIAGFLAFREVPALTKLYEDLCRRRPDLLPDVTLVDGNGVLHPQGFGLASHFGVLESIPTIGVGKTFLHVDGLTKPDVKGMMAKAREENHDLVKLTGKSGKVVWGAALCGTAGVKNPVYVSVGHMLSLDTSVAIAQACSKFRVPEPIRQADLRSREVIRQ
uniref:Endonuclease V n=1 Tax=Phytophthora ramorum TaxID=164328 RepID=H3G786_PHYRM